MTGFEGGLEKNGQWRGGVGGVVRAVVMGRGFRGPSATLRVTGLEVSWGKTSNDKNKGKSKGNSKCKSGGASLRQSGCAFGAACETQG